MTDIHDKEIADQIDREIAASDGLLALVLCLSTAAGLTIAGALSLMSVLT